MPNKPIRITPSKSTSNPPRTNRYNKIVSVSDLLTSRPSKKQLLNHRQWQWLTMGTILVTLPILVFLAKFPTFHSSKATNDQSIAILTPHEITITSNSKMSLMVHNQHIRSGNLVHVTIKYDPKTIEINSQDILKQTAGELIIEKTISQIPDPLTPLAAITTLEIKQLSHETQLTHVTITEDSYIKSGNQIISLTGNSASIKLN